MDCEAQGPSSEPLGGRRRINLLARSEWLEYRRCPDGLGALGGALPAHAGALVASCYCRRPGRPRRREDGLLSKVPESHRESVYRRSGF